VKTPPALAKVLGQPQTLMGSGGVREPYPLLSPVGTVVASDRPAFRWRAVEGATSYIVSLYDLKMNKVAESQPLRDAEWVADVSLKHGAVYSWQVRAMKDGAEVRLPPPEAPNAKFKVLEQSKLQAIEQAKQSHGDSHLVMGTLYAEAGLLDDAEREFETLARSNPRSQVAARLLRSLKAVRKK